MSPLWPQLSSPFIILPSKTNSLHFLALSLSQWLTDISRWLWTPKHLLTFPHFLIYTISVKGSSILKIIWSRRTAVTVTSFWPSLSPCYITSNFCCHLKIDLDVSLLLFLEISWAVWIFCLDCYKELVVIFSYNVASHQVAQKRQSQLFTTEAIFHHSSIWNYTVGSGKLAQGVKGFLHQN